MAAIFLFFFCSFVVTFRNVIVDLKKKILEKCGIGGTTGTVEGKGGSGLKYWNGA